MRPYSPRALSSLVAKTIPILTLGAVLSSCAGSSRVDGVLPSWANPQPQIVSPAQDETKNIKKQTEARKRRENQISQAGNKPETTSPMTSQASNAAEE